MGGFLNLTGKLRRLIIPMLVVGTTFWLAQRLIPEANADPEAWYLLHVLPCGHFWFVE